MGKLPSWRELWGNPLTPAVLSGRHAPSHSASQRNLFYINFVRESYLVISCPLLYATRNVYVSVLSCVWSAWLSVVCKGGYWYSVSLQIHAYIEQLWFHTQPSFSSLVPSPPDAPKHDWWIIVKRWEWSSSITRIYGWCILGVVKAVEEYWKGIYYNINLILRHMQNSARDPSLDHSTLQWIAACTLHYMYSLHWTTIRAVLIGPLHPLLSHLHADTSVSTLSQFVGPEEQGWLPWKQKKNCLSKTPVKDKEIGDLT